MINKSARSIVILLIIFSCIGIATADNTPVTYISYIDPDLGFYKITDITTHNPANYVSRTLTINQGDTVEWENDAGKQSTMTVISDQKLFPDTSLVDAGDNFSYTFNQAAVFTFYIKERRTVRQTIIVLPVSYSTSVPTPAITSPSVTTSVPAYNPSTTARIANNGFNESSNGTNGLEIGKVNSLPVSLTGIMSIIVGILSMLITYRKSST
ncbi:MAG: hypothetical protein FIB08_16075 [Candidatus Methanoperedens sp.]|nr:hypothetical protein [Candidatus Methanoperedens sp.]